MLNLMTETDQHSSQSTKLSRHTYQIIMHQPMLNLTTVTELSRHTYQTTSTNRFELNDCRYELNDHSRSTFLLRYQTQPTLRLVRLIEISVNWSIKAIKTIIDLRYLTIDYQIHISCQLFSH